MAELGSVFDDHGDADERPRGPDLRVTVEVPRAALGASLRAPVPTRIAADGDLVERVILDPEDPERVALHLPDQLPARAVLRLRGQGGVREDGRPGDLMVVVQLVDRPPRDDESITREVSVPSVRSEGAVATLAGVDVTWWVLLAIGVIGGGVLVAIAIMG